MRTETDFLETKDVYTRLIRCSYGCLWRGGLLEKKMLALNMVALPREGENFRALMPVHRRRGVNESAQSNCGLLAPGRGARPRASMIDTR